MHKTTGGYILRKKEEVIIGMRNRTVYGNRGDLFSL